MEMNRRDHCYLLVRATYTHIWVLLVAHIPFVVHCLFNKPSLRKDIVDQLLSHVVRAQNTGS